MVYDPQFYELDQSKISQQQATIFSEKAQINLNSRQTQLQDGHIGCLCSVWWLCYQAAAAYMHVSVDIGCIAAELGNERERGTESKSERKRVHMKENAPHPLPVLSSCL